MKRSKIFKLLKSDGPMEQVLIKGWVRTRRDSKGFSFIEVNDGSSLKNIQVVADEKLSGQHSGDHSTGAGRLSAAEKTPHRRIFKNNRPPAPPHEQIRCRLSHSVRNLIRDS